MQSLTPCSFCNKSFPQSQLHDCVSKAYSVLNSLAEEKKDPNTIFNGIENVVLQGGSVKGVSYLGSFQQILEENPNFMKNLKRVAGNSAGSIAALYIALNLDPYTDMEHLMDKNYLDLLDDGLALKVAVNITSWFGDYKYKNFRAKDIFVAALKGFEDLQGMMEKPKGPEEVQKLASEMFANILQYYSSKLGTAYSLFMRAGASAIADSAAKWLLSMLTPKPQPKSTYKLNSELPKKSFLPNEDTTNEENTNETNQNELNFEEVIRKAFQQAVLEAQNQHAEEAALTTIEKTVVTHVENTVKTVIADKDMLEAGFEKTTTSNFLTTQNSVSSSQNLSQVKNDDIKFYQSQRQQPLADIADKSELTGQILHYALGELIWFVIVSQIGADGIKEEIGLFSGDIVKQELIENAIKMAFANLNRLSEYNPGFTFQELYDFKDENGNRIFKPLFVTAFNTANLRTEVFSCFHTPNAVVSDAVRASISMPIFFTPVTIRENGVPKKIYFNDGKSSEVIRYMDGGVLDNYPIWIFDDLKYCLDDIPEWVAKRKIFIQNPKTLGFRLMEDRMIDIYTKPYYDDLRTKMKRVGTGNYEGTFGFLMGSFLQANVSKNLENEHIYRGDCPRSVYVDNLGISPVAFSLSKTDKDRLVKSGKQAILNYKIRAQTSFLGEGETYH